MAKRKQHSKPQKHPNKPSERHEARPTREQPQRNKPQRREEEEKNPERRW